MKRGTIILTPFPFTDHSKNKVKPALIVSSNNRKIMMLLLLSYLQS